MEAPNSSKERLSKMKKAATILKGFIRDGKVEQHPSKMILIDVESELYLLYEADIIDDPAQLLLDLRGNAELPVSDTCRDFFVSLPLGIERLEGLFKQLDVVRSSVEGVVNRPNRK